MYKSGIESFIYEPEKRGELGCIKIFVNTEGENTEIADRISKQTGRMGIIEFIVRPSLEFKNLLK